MPARLSTTEYAVLGVLAEQPRHGFALARQLGAEGEVGQVLTIRRPLVYRALDRLVEIGYAEPVATEPGDAGPQRVVLAATQAGRERLDDWLAEPVTHIRDLRLQFLLKVTLLTRAGRSPLELVRKQRRALESTFLALDDPTAAPDPVDLWRRHNASAASDYLDDLESRFVE
jgi:PadR family transcriptional regulator AphA